MITHRTLGISAGIVVTLLLLSAGIGFGITEGPTVGSTGDLTDTTTDHTRHVSVTASGSASAEPDTALIYLKVSAHAETPHAATSMVAANATMMRDALREIGIDDHQVRSTGFTVHEVRPPTRETRDTPVTYRATHTYEITLDDLDQTGFVLDTALENGATTVQSVQFTLSDEIARETRADALSNAMDTARANADVVAESGDLEIRRVHSASTSDMRIPTVRAERDITDGSMIERDPTVIEPGPITVSATVHVQYDIQ